MPRDIDTSSRVRSMPAARKRAQESASRRRRVLRKNHSIVAARSVSTNLSWARQKHHVTSVRLLSFLPLHVCTLPRMIVRFQTCATAIITWLFMFCSFYKEYENIVNQEGTLQGRFLFKNFTNGFTRTNERARRLAPDRAVPDLLEPRDRSICA